MGSPTGAGPAGPATRMRLRSTSATTTSGCRMLAAAASGEFDLDRILRPPTGLTRADPAALKRQDQVARRYGDLSMNVNGWYPSHSTD